MHNTDGILNDEFSVDRICPWITYIESWSQLESGGRMRMWKETVSMFPTNLGSYFFAPGEFVMKSFASVWMAVYYFFNLAKIPEISVNLRINGFV